MQFETLKEETIRKDPSRPTITLKEETIRKDPSRPTIALKEETIRKDPSRPTIALKSGFTCDGDDLYNGVRLCSVFGERCRIQTAKNGTVYLSGKEETRQNRIKLSSDATVPAQMLCSIDYLKDIARALAGSSITVQFDTDFPISLSAGPVPGLSVRYLLAPRLETEEDVGAWLE
jgi:hypothetical protein